MDKPQDSKVHTVKGLVDDVKMMMVSNIDRMLEREEQMHLLVDKTNHLSVEAQRFQTQGRSMYKTSWWGNKKMTLIAIGLFIVFVLLLWMIIAILRR